MVKMAHQQYTPPPPTDKSAAWIVRIDPQDARKLSFALWPRDFAHFPICRARSATTWDRRSDHWEARLHPDSRGDARVICRLPRLSAIGRVVIPRLPNVGDMDVLLRLIAMAVQAQGSSAHAMAKARGRRAIERASMNRAGSIAQIVHAKYSDGPGSSGYGRASDELPSLLDDHRDRYHQGAEAAAGSRQYSASRKLLRSRRSKLPIPILEFRSVRALLDALDRDTTSMESRRAVASSLRLWSMLEIEHLAWKSAHDPSKRFGPLVRLLETDRQTIRLRLSAALLDALGGYCLRVPLPLPAAFNSPAGLNLQLWALSLRPSRNATDADTERLLKRRLDQLALTIGLTPGEPRFLWRQLETVVDGLPKIAKERRLNFRTQGDGKIVFFRDRPRPVEIPKPRRQPERNIEEEFRLYQDGAALAQHMGYDDEQDKR